MVVARRRPRRRLCIQQLHSKLPPGVLILLHIGQSLSNLEGLAKFLFNNRLSSSRANKRMCLAKKAVPGVAAHRASNGSLEQEFHDSGL